jgi:hypothetical protein
MRKVLFIEARVHCSWCASNVGERIWMRAHVCKQAHGVCKCTYILCAFDENYNVPNVPIMFTNFCYSVPIQKCNHSQFWWHFLYYAQRLDTVLTITPGIWIFFADCVLPFVDCASSDAYLLLLPAEPLIFSSFASTGTVPGVAFNSGLYSS